MLSLPATHPPTMDPIEPMPPLVIQREKVMAIAFETLAELEAKPLFHARGCRFLTLHGEKCDLCRWIERHPLPEPVVCDDQLETIRLREAV